MIKKFFVALTALVWAFAAEAVPEGASIRVASYNIRCISKKDKGDRSWNERKADVAQFIKKINADVIGLQEATPPQLRYLKSALPEYVFTGASRSKGGEGVPVCYRKDAFEEVKSGTFWLSQNPDMPGSIGWGAKYPRVCTYVILKDAKTGKKFCFANTHTDHKSEKAREKGMMLIIERMKDFGEGCPVVLTGDHNCCDTEAPAVSARKVMDDAMYSTKTPPKGPWRSFTGWHVKETETGAAEALKLPAAERFAKCGSRIDYIYVTRDTTVRAYATVPEKRPGKDCYYSDHFPVVAEISF